jgi:hypothetical protein
VGVTNLEPVIYWWVGAVYDDVRNFLLFLSGICANDTSMNKTMTDFVGGVGLRLAQKSPGSSPIYSVPITPQMACKFQVHSAAFCSGIRPEIFQKLLLIQCRFQFFVGTNTGILR